MMINYFNVIGKFYLLIDLEGYNGENIISFNRSEEQSVFSESTMLKHIEILCVLTLL